MRAPFSMAALATLLVAGSMVAYAARADNAPADAGKNVSECLYRDAHYGLGAVICVAQKYGQQCGDKSTWTKPSADDPYDKVCASAQIPVPGTPPAQCMYHDVKYSPGALICVAPSYGQTCAPDGWSVPASVEECKNAQIPAPTYPAAPAAAK